MVMSQYDSSPESLALSSQFQLLGDGFQRFNAECDVLI
jgi:hypothetical protein